MKTTIYNAIKLDTWFSIKLNEGESLKLLNTKKEKIYIMRFLQPFFPQMFCRAYNNNKLIIMICIYHVVGENFEKVFLGEN